MQSPDILKLNLWGLQAEANGTVAIVVLFAIVLVLCAVRQRRR